MVCSDMVSLASTMLSLFFSSIFRMDAFLCIIPQETVRQLQQFSELTYRYAVAAMKEEVTFDEAPDHFRGERQSDWAQHTVLLCQY